MNPASFVCSSVVKALIYPSCADYRFCSVRMEGVESIALFAGLVRSFLSSTFAEVMSSEDFVDWSIWRLGWRLCLDSVSDLEIRLRVGSAGEVLIFDFADLAWTWCFIVDWHFAFLSFITLLQICSNYFHEQFCIVWLCHEQKKILLDHILSGTNTRILSLLV